jgi:hypothetical protein
MFTKHAIHVVSNWSQNIIQAGKAFDLCNNVGFIEFVVNSKIPQKSTGFGVATPLHRPSFEEGKAGTTAAMTTFPSSMIYSA